ncbi:MAG: hypothetical protein RIR26_2731 [Pseudomonadota bacterium]|jgi:group I intron endonuclease
MSDTSFRIIPPRSINRTFRIYLAINRCNGFIYVGKESGYLHKRRDLHFAEARRGCTRAFSSALREFGFENFSFHYVFQTNVETEANERERKLISKLATNGAQGGAGYNMTNGSQGGCRWKFEDVQKIALMYNERLQWARGHPSSYYTARYHGWLNRASSHMNCKLQQWTSAKVLKSARRYKTMFEFKTMDRKAYDAARQRGMLEQIASRMLKSKATIGTPVMMDGLHYFKSISDASRAIGAPSANIHACLYGRRKIAKGHLFRLATKQEVAVHDPSIQFADYEPPTVETSIRTLEQSESNPSTRTKMKSLQTARRGVQNSPNTGKEKRIVRQARK